MSEIKSGVRIIYSHGGFLSVNDTVHFKVKDTMIKCVSVSDLNKNTIKNSCRSKFIEFITKQYDLAEVEIYRTDFLHKKGDNDHDNEEKSSKKENSEKR